MSQQTIHFPVSSAAGGLMGWTARAGSFVVEKMNIFSHTESVPNTSIAHKQPSFLERLVQLHEDFFVFLNLPYKNLLYAFTFSKIQKWSVGKKHIQKEDVTSGSIDHNMRYTASQDLQCNVKCTVLMSHPVNSSSYYT